MTPEQINQLEAVNAAVNAIPYDGTPRVGEDAAIWKDTPDDGLWVCRCYVLDKRKKLIELGWPPAALTVVECYTEAPQNEYHAVLCVEVGGEDWLLDSRSGAVYRKDRPVFAYRWDRRQIAGSIDWESLA